MKYFQTWRHTYRHDHLLPRLPPAGGRHRHVLPSHLLPPQSGHPGVPQSQRHELVQVSQTLTGWTIVQCLLFRVPMNVMTCGALLCLHVDTISQDKRIVFGACFILCIIGKSKLATMFINSRFYTLYRNAVEPEIRGDFS